jgi:UDP-N-acetylglucosamine acyltransferase
MSVSIHPTAIVDPDTRMGRGVEIGAYTVIEGDVEIGEGCRIWPHVMIGSGTRIGNGSRIFKGASVGLEPQDLKFKGEKTYLRIGENTTIREFCTLNRGTEARGETVIGNNCLLMAYCHVAHDCIIGDNVVIANCLAMAGHVEVGDNVGIGGIVPIHQFTRIGEYAYIAAVARPFMDVVPYALCGGDPSRIVGINKVGLDRHGFDQQRKQTIKRAYKILFRKNLLLDDALKMLEEKFGDNRDIEKLIAFCRKSERGIMRMETADTP